MSETHLSSHFSLRGRSDLYRQLSGDHMIHHMYDQRVTANQTHGFNPHSIIQPLWKS